MKLLNKFLVMTGLSFLLVTIVSCSGNGKVDNTDSTVDSENLMQDSALIEESNVMDEKTIEEDKKLITDFYNTQIFDYNEEPTEKFLTPECVNKLIAAQDYEDGGMNLQEFRTMAQDGDGDSKITDIEPIGDGWYKVSYIDMGSSKGITDILIKDGKIADYKRVFDSNGID